MISCQLALLLTIRTPRFPFPKRVLATAKLSDTTQNTLRGAKVKTDHGRVWSNRKNSPKKLEGQPRSILGPKKSTKASSNQLANRHHGARKSVPQDVLGAKTSRYSEYRGSRQCSKVGPELRSASRNDSLSIDELARLTAFRTDLDLELLHGAFEKYRSVKSLLARKDLLELTRLLHDYCRNPSRATHSPRNEKPARYLLEAANELVDDIRAGQLAVHPFAFVHLITLYKELNELDEGVRFWDWLVRREDEFNSLPTYGAAIELLSAFGEELPVLEDLYQQALQRFPGDFAAYHLSPGAILPNRAALLTAHGSSMALLQGICTARLEAGDLRNGYLALDTALRLHPTDLPPRFFELFIAKRPVAEAYTTFLLAQRCGAKLSSKALNDITLSLAHHASSCRKTKAPESRSTIFALAHLGMNAILASVESGTDSAATTLLALVRAIYPVLADTKQLPPAEAGQLAIAIKQLLASTKFNSSLIPNRAANTLWSTAGKLGSVELFEELWMASASTISPSLKIVDDVQLRVLLTAAGDLKLQHAVREIWMSFSSRIGTEFDRRPAATWTTFARAARAADAMDYFHEQLEMYRPKLEDEDQSEIDALAQNLARFEVDERLPFHPDGEAVASDLQSILEQVERIRAKLESPALRNFKEMPYQMLLGRPRIRAAREQLRRVYDNMTTDSNQKRTEASTEIDNGPSLSSGFTIEDLRFENWATMNELLAEAMADLPSLPELVIPHLKEHEYESTSDEALEQQIRRLRQPLPPKPRFPQGMQDKENPIEVSDQ